MNELSRRWWPLLVTFGLSIVIQNGLLLGYGADSRRLQAGAFESSSVTLAPGLSVGLAQLQLSLVGDPLVVVVEERRRHHQVSIPPDGEQRAVPEQVVDPGHRDAQPVGHLGQVEDLDVGW